MKRSAKGSRSGADADEDRGEGADEGGKDTEGPWGRRMEAWVKTVSRTVVQKGSRTIEDNGKAKRNLAPG